MHQKTVEMVDLMTSPKKEFTKFVGGGNATDEEYTTWEVKECPVCGRLVLEHYTAIPILENESDKIVAGLYDVTNFVARKCQPSFAK